MFAFFLVEHRIRHHQVVAKASKGCFAVIRTPVFVPSQIACIPLSCYCLDIIVLKNKAKSSSCVSWSEEMENTASQCLREKSFKEILKPLDFEFNSTSHHRHSVFRRWFITDDSCRIFKSIKGCFHALRWMFYSLQLIPTGMLSLDTLHCSVININRTTRQSLSLSITLSGEQQPSVALSTNLSQVLWINLTRGGNQALCCRTFSCQSFLNCFSCYSRA